MTVILLGIIEGITEWLPISSTGHMLLFDSFITLDATPQFKSMFFVVIQLGAILAVIVLYWKKLWPLKKDENKLKWKKDTLSLWLKTIVAIIPSGIVGILFDDWMDEHLHTPSVIAMALILYGIFFIVIEKYNRTRTPLTASTDDITYPLPCTPDYSRFSLLFPVHQDRAQQSSEPCYSDLTGQRQQNFHSSWEFPQWPEHHL